jgi:formylglycine-generating enzyme required for sulfatase activity
MKHCIFDKDDSFWLAKLTTLLAIYLASVILWGIAVWIMLLADIKDPVRIVATLWGVSYPLTLIIGLVLAIITRFFRWRMAYNISFLMPFFMTLVAIVAATIAGGYAMAERKWESNAFWRDPPRQIEELILGTAFEKVTRDPALAYVFILPEVITKMDIVAWDGQTLIYQTSLQPDAVGVFYRDAYKMIGFEYPLGGGRAGAYDLFEYEIDEDTLFYVLISTEKHQRATRVGIVTCQDEPECRHFEMSEWYRSPMPGPTPVGVTDSAAEILIPAGSFQMGCDHKNRVERCRADEVPLHSVTLDAYYIDKYEVTNARYQACVGAGGCTAPSSNSSYTRLAYYGNPTYADYPVMNVTRAQAVAFCAWEGKRLPTEAEWEKAARGSSDTRKYPWGNQVPDCMTVNFLYEGGSETGYCVGDTNQVGTYPNGASPYGVMDMAGNVWEWVNDWYGEHYYRTSPTDSPPGPEKGDFKQRVLRGGSWNDDANDVRSALRVDYSDKLDGYFGFRCARTP